MFLIVYEATQGTQPDFFPIKKLDPILEDTDFLLSAAKGFEAALKDLGAVNRPYNAYAIPSESGQLYVYLLPAQSKGTVYPHSWRRSLYIQCGRRHADRKTPDA
jgi:hypothetical protein